MPLPAPPPLAPPRAPATAHGAPALPSTALPGPPPPALPEPPPTALPGLPPAAPQGPYPTPQGPYPTAPQEPSPTALPGPLPPGQPPPAPPKPLPSALPGPPARPAVPSFLPGPPARPTNLPNPSQEPILPPPPPPTFDPNDPQLNFFSEHFDALKALYTPGLRPPVPRVKALDNVVKCRLILPPELPESYAAWHAAHPKVEPTEEAIKQKVLSKHRTAAVLKREQDQAAKGNALALLVVAASFICMQESLKQKVLSKHRTAAVLKREQDQAAKGNTLDKIAEKFKEGPLLLLRRYYKTSVRLQVVTRHASGVRGTATGYLHGFDKFMNLVLMNVDEKYTVMMRVPHPYTVTVYEPVDPQPPATYTFNPITGQQELQLAMVQKQINKFRWKRKAEKRTRRLHQVFLRGDNIVTVTPVLHDVQKNWNQLLPQWRKAGFPEAALVTAAALAMAGSALPPSPPPPPHFPPAAAQMLPNWSANRR